jgi:hypothetical protein
MHSGCAAAEEAASNGSAKQHSRDRCGPRATFLPASSPASCNTPALPPENRRGSCANIHRIRLAQTSARSRATQCEIDDVGVVINRAESCTRFLHVCRVHKRRPHAASHSLAQLRLRPRPVECRRQSNVSMLHQYSILVMSRAISLNTCAALVTSHRKDSA